MRLDRDRCLMVCDYCRSEAVPPVDEEGVQITGATSHSCPSCKSNLSEGLMERQPLLYCEKCHGVLIAMDKFLPLVEHLRALRDRPAVFLPAPADDLVRHFHCPLCGGSMDSHRYAGPGNVNIDTCEACSTIWLDRSELRRIVVAPDPRPVYSDYELAGDRDAD
jgi:Zn-finger nucleic acid-binding protein